MCRDIRNHLASSQTHCGFELGLQCLQRKLNPSCAISGETPDWYTTRKAEICSQSNGLEDVGASTDCLQEITKVSSVKEF